MSTTAAETPKSRARRPSEIEATAELVKTVTEEEKILVQEPATQRAESTSPQLNLAWDTNKAILDAALALRDMALAARMAFDAWRYAGDGAHRAAAGDMRPTARAHAQSPTEDTVRLASEAAKSAQDYAEVAKEAAQAAQAAAEEAARLSNNSRSFAASVG